MASFGVFGLMALVCFLGLTSSKAVDKGGIVNDSQGELVFTHIIYRNGDRLPAAFYQTETFRSKNSWPFNLGELSNTGKIQHFKFGKWLRERYDEVFLPKPYSEKNIYVRATDEDRIISSALSNLAGLYPPNDDQVWNKSIHWQPIPVHKVPLSDDWLLGVSLPPCPVYEQAMNQVMALPDVQNVIFDYNTRINNAIQTAGLSLDVSSLDLLQDVRMFRDTLLVETLYQKPLPAWTKSIYPSEWIDRAALLRCSLPSYTAQLAKFRMGYLLKEILDRSLDKAIGTYPSDQSVYVYSAQDITISTVLQGLGMWDNNFVQYAAALLFEVRIHEDLPYLEIYYKQTADTKTPTLMYIPNCGYACPLPIVYDLYDNILPKHEFKTECNM